MTRTKGPDEVFCRSCGERIKRAAEICPECGVRNQEAESAPSGSTANRSTATSTTSAAHDPSEYETTVSDSWYYAVAGGVLLSVVGWTIFSGDPTGIVEDVGGFSILLAWFGMPVGLYYDTQYVRANSRWNPNTVVWVILALVWFVNVVAGVAYLYRRHETLGVP